MKKILFIFFNLIFISSTCYADRYTDLQDSIDELRDELEHQRFMREIDELNRIRNSPSTNLPPPKFRETRICHVIWNGESFEKTLNEPIGLFYVEIVDNKNTPFIKLFLPRSYESDRKKLQRFIKDNIEKVKLKCK